MLVCPEDSSQDYWQIVIVTVELMYESIWNKIKKELIGVYSACFCELDDFLGKLIEKLEPTDCGHRVAAHTMRINGWRTILVFHSRPRPLLSHSRIRIKRGETEHTENRSELTKQDASLRSNGWALPG